MKLSPNNHNLSFFLLIMRLWFASLLIYNVLHMNEPDSVTLLFGWIGDKIGINANAVNTFSKIIQLIFGVLLIAGVFTRALSIVIMVIMLIALLTSLMHLIKYGAGNDVLTKILFWFATIMLIYGAGKWNADQMIGRSARARR